MAEVASGVLRSVTAEAQSAHRVAAVAGREEFFADRENLFARPVRFSADIEVLSAGAMGARAGVTSRAHNPFHGGCMRASQAARLDALGRIQTFLDQHTDVVGTINKSTSRTTLDHAVSRTRSA